MRKIAPFLLFLACERVPLGDGPRKAAIRAVADDVIVPTYEELSLKARALADAADAFRAGPGDTALAAAQSAWRAARVPWMQGEAFLFGPVKDDFLDAAIDQTIDTARIEDIIAGDAELTPSYVASLGANRKGFHAVEYLLFGDVSTARRRDLAAALAADIAVRCDALLAAWREQGYATRFVEIGRPGAAFSDVKAALDTVVNENVFLIEVIQDTKLGRPMGKTSGTPDPALAESLPSDNSLDDIASNLTGLEHVWRGTRDGAAETGVGAVVARTRPALDVRVVAEIAAAKSAIAAVPRPFADALVARAPELDAAYEAIRTLRHTLAADVVAALGATLSFNPNDGD